MFIEITQQSPGKKLSETATVLGSAIAALSASVLQEFHNPEKIGLAYRGIYLLCFGIIAYVLRDWIKDWARGKLSLKFRQWFPDHTTHLYADGKPIGSVQEWFRTKKISQIKTEIQKIRKSAFNSEVEQGSLEDVFHFQKTQTLTSPLISEVDKNWAIQMNTRINIERYLKHMDDPVKELAVLDSGGRLQLFSSRRVYHFYLIVELSEQKKQSQSGNCLFFRIVLDKKGIDRIEEINLQETAVTLSN
jgi:hypothetical protein